MKEVLNSPSKKNKEYFIQLQKNLKKPFLRNRN